MQQIFASKETYACRLEIQTNDDLQIVTAMSQARNRPSKAPHKAGGVATNISGLAHSIASESQAEGETPGSAGNVELENQFILRLPTEPAKALKEALRSGAGNIKERLSIQLEPEKGSTDPRLRKGIVEFDGWNMSAKVFSRENDLFNYSLCIYSKILV